MLGCDAHTCTRGSASSDRAPALDFDAYSAFRQDCASRARTSAGGTGKQNPYFGTGDDADWGLLSNATGNPMGTWHAIFVVYCEHMPAA